VAQLVPLSPEWWMKRLYSQLVARRAEIEFFDDYYTGNHPLPWVAPQARDEFRRLVRMTRSNYMGLVCDAQVERMAIQGFRVGTDWTRTLIRGGSTRRTGWTRTSIWVCSRRRSVARRICRWHRTR
jgi:hypothetical protein